MVRAYHAPSTTFTRPPHRACEAELKRIRRESVGNALARVGAEAGRRGVAVRTLRSDADDLAPYGDDTYDLVSLQYGSFHRTPDQRGVDNLLPAVAPGGTLLIVGHDLTSARQQHDPSTQTQMYDPDAFVGVDEIAARLEESSAWRIDVHETRPRPAGAISTHHVHDVVLRAVRTDADPHSEPMPQPRPTN